MSGFEGNNDLRLNAATMVKAVQLWVDATFVNAPLVTSVHVETNGSVQTFIVKTEAKPKGTP